MLKARLHPSDKKALVALGLLVSLVYLPALVAVLLGSFPYPDDALAYYWPWRDWIRGELLSGKVPLWNPYLFCGQPAITLGMSFLCYPPNLLLTPLPSAWAIFIESWGHNLFLAAGAYFLLRAWGLGRTSSWVGAALMALSNSVAAHLYAGHNTWHDARAYIPWILLATLLYLRSGALKFLPLLALLFWLQFTAAYPPITLLTAGACVYMVVARMVKRLRNGQRPALPGNWPIVAIGLPIGIVLLTGAALLPFYEVAKQAVHANGMTFEEATELSASWKTFVRLALPDYFGGNTFEQWSALFSPHEEAASFGLLALALALLAPILWRREKNAPPGLWALWGALAFGAVIALGNNTPVYHWIWSHFGFFRSLRVPARWMEIWAIVGPILAASGVELWMRRGVPGRKWVALVAGLSGVCVLVTIGSVLLGNNFWLESAQWNRRLFLPNESLKDRLEAAATLQQSALFAALSGAVLCALGAAMLARWNRASNGMERSQAVRLTVAILAVDALLPFLKSAQIIPPNEIQRRVSWPQDLVQRWKPGSRWNTDVPLVTMSQGMRYGIPVFGGYNPLSSGRFWQYASANDGGGNWRGPYQASRVSPLLRMAGVTHTLQLNSDGAATPPKSFPASVSSIIEAKSGKWTLWRHVYTSPEGKELPSWQQTYAADRIHYEPSGRLTALMKIGQEYTAGNQPVILESDAQKASIRSSKVAVKRDEQSWSESVHRWSVAGNGTVLVHGEASAPGWKAYLDGQPVKVENGNHLFMAVSVPQGSHRVGLVFNSTTQRLGIFFTLCGLLGLGVWGGNSLGRRKSLFKCPDGTRNRAPLPAPAKLPN